MPHVSALLMQRRPSFSTALPLLLLLACAKPQADPLPLADFQLPATAEAGSPVAFQNASQLATQYTWSFGDGTTDQSASPTHTYAAPGTYQVQLEAATAQHSAIATKSIRITKYDVFAHATIPLTGQYLCQSIRRMTFNGATTSVRLRDTLLTVQKIGPDSLRINTVTGSATTDPFFRGPGADKAYNFRLSTPLDYSYASFYPTGDSLYVLSYAHIGHSGGTTYILRGTRRP